MAARAKSTKTTKSSKSGSSASEVSFTYIDAVNGKKIPEKRFYIFSGTDPYTFNKLEKILTEKFLSDDPSFFNRYKVECSGNTKGEEIVNACEEYPFGSQYRLVIAGYASRMKSAEGDKIKRYLNDPAETSVLIMSEDTEELKSKASGKFYPSRSLKKETQKNGLVIHCTLNFRDVKQWVGGVFEERGRQIDSNALNLLTEMVGNNLWDLNQEIEKIILYAGDRKHITDHDVEAVTHHRPQSKIFNFTEQVGLKNISSVLTILDELYREKTPSVMIIISLNNHFTFLYQIKELMDEGMQSEEIARQLKKHPFYVKKSMTQAQRFSESSFDKIFDLLARADGALKSGRAERNVMELTLIQICRQKE